MDEIYSHIMPTHNFDIADQNRIVISFTDDIDVVCSFTEKYPTTYAKIGYIDIKIPENASALLKGDSSLLLVKPVLRLSDWVDLAGLDGKLSELKAQGRNLNQLTILSHQGRSYPSQI